MGSVFLLQDAFLQNIIQVTVLQSLLKLLLSGGIDPFSYDPGALSQDHCLPIRRDHGKRFFLRRLYGHAPAGFAHAAQMLRRGPATASHDSRPFFHNVLHGPRKFLRTHIVIRLIAPLLRQSGIGLHDHRNGCAGQKLFQNRHHLNRPQSAVHPKGIHPQAFQQADNGRNIRTGEQFFPFIKNGGHKHGQLRILLCRQHRRLDLISIAHRLDVDQIRARLFPVDYGLLKGFVCGLKFQIPHRL